MTARKTAAQKRAEAAAAEEAALAAAAQVDELDDDLELDDELDEVDDEAEDEVEDTELEDDTDDELDEPAPEPKKMTRTRKPKASTPDDEGDEPVEREEYTAKQVATRIGTDAKTLRKFFRSDASTVEPVGQGGRYVFDAADLPKIRAEFTKWNTTKPVRTPGATKKATAPKGRQAPAGADLIEEDDEILELDDEDSDPTDEELDDLDDVEVDDDELED